MGLYVAWGFFFLLLNCFFFKYHRERFINLGLKAQFIQNSNAARLQLIAMSMEALMIFLNPHQPF